MTETKPTETAAVETTETTETERKYPLVKVNGRVEEFRAQPGSEDYAAFEAFMGSYTF